MHFLIAFLLSIMRPLAACLSALAPSSSSHCSRTRCPRSVRFPAYQQHV